MLFSGDMNCVIIANYLWKFNSRLNWGDGLFSSISGLCRHSISALLIIFLIVSFLPVSIFVMQCNGSSGGTDDWSMFRHDPEHSGYSTSRAPLTNQTLWSQTIGDIADFSYIFSSPAVADGKVYFGSIDGKVYCLNAATGAFVWNYTIGSIVVSSPAVADGKVYIGTYDIYSDGKVYCLNADTGVFIWSYTTGDVASSSITVVDGRVYVGSFEHTKMYCLNADYGKLIWSYTTDGGVYSSPAVADGKVYIGAYNLGLTDNKVYCLNANSGTLIWSYTTGRGVYSSPAVADGKVYIGAMDNKVYCLNAATGALVWSYTTGDWVGSSPAVVDGRVYVGSDDDNVYCLNADTGALIWSYTTGNAVWYCSPAVADGNVYIASLDGNVYCLNADDGAFIWSYATGSDVYSSPVVAYGKLFVGSYDGVMYCFGSPCISDFDSLFKFNNVRMVYPSDQTPKPLGCSAAWISDWTASAFIYTKLTSVTEGTDVESAFVNQASGKPAGAGGLAIVSFGGPLVNSVVAYAQDPATATLDRAPIKFSTDNGNPCFQHSDGTSIPDANLEASTVNNNLDMFVIESYLDGDGRYILLCYGFGWKGTYAAGKYFDAEIYPNIDSYDFSWIIVKWEDTNGNGFVNTATDGDTYTVISFD